MESSGSGPCGRGPEPRATAGANLTGHFDAFAGSNKIDSQLTYNDTTFGIGNPNLPGGINRIRSQACVSGDGGAFVCSTQWNDIRD